MEGHAELAGKRVLDVHQVLLAQGLVQPEGSLHLGANFRRQVWVLRKDRRIVSGLSLHQEKGHTDYKEQSQDYLSGAPCQVVAHLLLYYYGRGASAGPL